MKWTVGAGWLQTPPASAVAVTLLMWGVFTFLLWIVTFRLSKGGWSIFLLLWITFFFLASGGCCFLFSRLTCGPIVVSFRLLTVIDSSTLVFLLILHSH